MSGQQVAELKQTVDSFNQSLKLHGGANNQLGKDDFLKLLTTQLQYQDPSAPMQDTQFIAQMAQFSSLEQMTNMANGFNQLNTLLESQNAVSALGRNVTIDSGGTPIQGQVSAVTRGENPQVKVNGTYYPWKDVSGFQAAAMEKAARAANSTTLVNKQEDK
jgi:flagellar basal-body rod modification protein FlgD